MNKELSSLTIGTTGIENLPDNFSGAGKRQQKEIIVAAMQEHHHNMIKLNDEIRMLEKKQKQTQQLLKNSAEYQEVVELKRNVKENKALINALLMESQGMMKIARKLGIDIKPGSIKQIEYND